MNQNNLDKILSQSGVFIIAEVGQAHDGSLGTAHAFIDAAAKAGADAIKFQTHIAEAESTPAEPWRIKFSYEDKTRFDYWKRMEFTENGWKSLKIHAEEKGLVFLSSPFSIQAAKLLQELGIQIWKVASGEVSDPWLMEFMLDTNKPLIFSTGMSPISDIDNYAGKLREKMIPFGILQCTSKYPVQPSEVGLNVMQDLALRYNVPVGLSDHSGEIFPSLAAVSLGARIIEVHICMNKSDFGPDVGASLDLNQLSELVRGIRYITQALSHPVDKNIMSDDLRDLNRIFSKSICAARDIHIGEVLSRDNLALKKPGFGVPARDVESVIGKTAIRDFHKDEFIEVGKE